MWGVHKHKTAIMATVTKIKDIIPYIKWGNISNDFLGFSRGWIYQRLNGYDGNGNECDFTDEQKTKLKEALFELSEMLKEAAKKI